MAKSKINRGSNDVIAKDAISVTKSPMVFISHDTRDAGVAEAFSDLLRSVSAGVLKSFRSSDNKGNQGIEFGQAWYQFIMDKIDLATDVVCLLTKNSIDRPWILYEAGVSKGKLDTTVLGVAIGISLTEATKGPFGQFQNCNDDVDALTKLISQLVKRIPGSEPDAEVIKAQVIVFKKKSTELLAKAHKDGGKKDKKEMIEDTSVAKLFEEVKIMFKDLPQRLENRSESEGLRRKKRKIHPMMFEQVMNMGMISEDPNLAFLMLISLYRDDFPWFYEIGVETYRELRKAKTISEKRKLLITFERAFEMLNHPMTFELYDKSEEMHFFFKESRYLIHNIMDRFHQEEGKKE
jgi:hypothetical protein